MKAEKGHVNVFDFQKSNYSKMEKTYNLIFGKDQKQPIGTAYNLRFLDLEISKIKKNRKRSFWLRPKTTEREQQEKFDFCHKND